MQKGIKATHRDCAVCKSPVMTGDGKMVLLPQTLGKKRGGGQIRLCCSRCAAKYG